MGGGCSKTPVKTPIESVQGGECCVSRTISSDYDEPRGLGMGQPGIGPHASTGQRLLLLEQLVEDQAQRIRELEMGLATVQRDCRRTVSVLQYNILASYLGQNTQPWFLYGTDISRELRDRILVRYNERDAQGKPIHSWPDYVAGLLTPIQIEAVERCDINFRWNHRKVRLLEQIQEFDADVISLVELDQHEYFADSLGGVWDTCFHKRPRAASLDGCGVFWRRSKFVCLATQGIHFVDGTDDLGRERRDRSCLMVLLRWRACKTPLVIVSTHLAKDPDNRTQTAIRVRQVAQIMEGLTDFTAANGAYEAPVILLGDLNARHFGEIRGITRTVWQIRGSPIHKFLWRASDVPTGPTSITKARQCRIDVVQFLSNQLEIVDVVPLPRLPEGEVIPNAQHPSDHFPVCVTFEAKDTYQKHKETARSWLECVAGREKLHPLTEDELKVAFQFFDRDCSGRIHRHDLEEACLDLQCQFHGDVQTLLLSCFPDQQISYANFIRAYELRLNHERMRCIGDLEYAFQYLANDSNSISISDLEAAFREITPISFSDYEVKDMIKQLNLEEGQTSVDLHLFCQIVCHTTLPHRDRRRFSKMPQVVPELREGNLKSADSRHCSLSRRLNQFNDTILSSSTKANFGHLAATC
mmetsp:Transcript_100695/g.285368  ORF Transcript_100695/g.285368 Transcript_100695/m.285368 type:complete len:641 (+) Transcript_100695:152-2074(+)